MSISLNSMFTRISYSPHKESSVVDIMVSLQSNLTIPPTEEVSNLRQKSISVVSFSSDTPTAERQEVLEIVTHIYLWLKYTDHRCSILWSSCIPSSIQCVRFYSSINLFSSFVTSYTRETVYFGVLEIVRRRIWERWVESTGGRRGKECYNIFPSHWYHFLQAHCISVNLNVWNAFGLGLIIFM